MMAGEGHAVAGEDARPRGPYYGWWLLGALSWGQVTSWGILYYGFSVFVAPMERELGWSRAALTGAFSLALLCSGFAGPVIGRWVDRHGPRLLMTLGSIVAALLLFAWSRVATEPIFLLIFVGLGLAMAATLYEPAFAAIATWFSRYRARALTIITFVGGFASVIYIPLISRLVNTYGWRRALLILAVMLAILTIPPHALILRRRPEDLGLVPDGGPGPAQANGASTAEASVSAKNALRSGSFRWLTIGFCLAFFANVAVTVHLIPYLTDHGFSPAFAASAAGLIGILALPGRLLFTPLGGRVPRRFVAGGIFAVQAVGIVVLVLTGTTAGVVAFVILFGIGFGAITPARAALVAELYGRANYGTISGTLALFVTGARALAPVSVGLLYGFFGRYEPVFWIVVGVALLATGAITLVDDRGPVPVPHAA
ncbi:MAG TPA: MFS transporter [Thermomicrobiales bacterium]|jgi:MFS family permease